MAPYFIWSGRLKTAKNCTVKLQFPLKFYILSIETESMNGGGFFLKNSAYLFFYQVCTWWNIAIALLLNFFFAVVNHKRVLYFLSTYPKLMLQIRSFVCLVNVFCAQKILSFKVNYKTFQVTYSSTKYCAFMHLWALNCSLIPMTTTKVARFS